MKRVPLFIIIFGVFLCLISFIMPVYESPIANLFFGQSTLFIFGIVICLFAAKSLLFEKTDDYKSYLLNAIETSIDISADLCIIGIQDDKCYLMANHIGSDEPHIIFVFHAAAFKEFVVVWNGLVSPGTKSLSSEFLLHDTESVLLFMHDNTSIVLQITYNTPKFILENS